MVPLDSSFSVGNCAMVDRFDPPKTLEYARKDFARFEENPSGRDIEHFKKHLLETLAAAGVDMAALDPTGQSTAEQMQERLDRAVARGHLDRARKLFAYFEEGHTGVQRQKQDILRHLRLAGDKSLSALDPSGKSAEEEIEERLKQAAKFGHLLEARAAFVQLEKGSTWVDNCIEEIRKGLVFAEADKSALDPSGRSTKEEMEEIYEQVVACAHLRKADKDITELEKNFDKGGGYRALKKIKERLEKAGAEFDDTFVERTEIEIPRLKEAVMTLSEEFLAASMDVRRGGIPATKPFKIVPVSERRLLEEVERPEVIRPQSSSDFWKNEIQKMKDKSLLSSILKEPFKK